jgi:hypothetical protein
MHIQTHFSSILGRHQQARYRFMPIPEVEAAVGQLVSETGFMGIAHFESRMNFETREF